MPSTTLSPEDEDTQPTRTLSDDLDCLTLKEARAVLSLIALAAAMPRDESAAHRSPDSFLHFWRQAFDLLS